MAWNVAVTVAAAVPLSRECVHVTRLVALGVPTTTAATGGGGNSDDDHTKRRDEGHYYLL